MDFKKFIVALFIYILFWVLHDLLRMVFRKVKRHIKNLKKLNKFIDKTSKL